MPPPNDSVDSPSPEYASPWRTRRRLIFTLPGENTAEPWSEPTARHGQHSSDPLFAAAEVSSGSGKRSGDYATYLAEMAPAAGMKRQRISEDYGHLEDKCIMCRFLDVLARCYKWACVSLLAWLYFRWFS
ncbi:uncharacterized protein [Dermacentor albipictus]|uniref:uncharacterized protein isoform X2 n=1 Tax=Dermacentor albipictus TaxID=60249 RepID=UPI0031FD9273